MWAVCMLPTQVPFQSVKQSNGLCLAEKIDGECTQGLCEIWSVMKGLYSD